MAIKAELSGGFGPGKTKMVRRDGKWKLVRTMRPPTELEKKKLSQKDGIGATMEIESVMYKTLAEWSAGNITPSLANKMANLPFLYRGEEAADNVLYRLLFLPGLTELPKKTFIIKPRRACDSWSTEGKGMMNYRNNGFYLSSFDGYKQGGLLVAIRHKFTREDVVVCPYMVWDKFRDKRYKNFLQRLGMMRQREVIMRTQTLRIAPGNMAVIKYIPSSDRRRKSVATYEPIMESVMKSVLARLETAMQPYKPKMGKRRLKTDPEHVMDRRATKLRRPSDKVTDSRKDKIYYKKNKNQLLQRHARSRQLHKQPATATVLDQVHARLAQHESAT